MAGRFFQGYPWRWALTDLDTATIALVDRVSAGKQVLRDLNRPWTMSGQAPSADPLLSILHDDGRPYLAANVRLLYGFRDEGGSPPWVVQASGIVLQLSEEADEDESVSKYVAYDPWQLLYRRPMRNSAGALAAARFDGVSADEVALTLLQRTIDVDGPVRIDAGAGWSGTAGWAGSIENPLGLVVHEFAKNVSVGEAWDWLVAAGYLDIELAPIYDPVDRPGYLSDLSIHAEKGSTRHNAVFAWDMGPRSVTKMTRLEDGTKLANIVVADGAAGSDITASASDSGSVAMFGPYFGQQIQVESVDRDVLTNLAAIELLLRKEPPETVAITPAVGRAPIPFVDYDVGDRVPVWASSRLRKPIDGDASPSRVRGIHVEISDDGYEDVGQLVTDVAA